MTTREYMAKKLREFRSASGMSVDAVGEQIGKSGKTISAWEVGRGQPDADKLVELCRLYKVKISDFYTSEVSQSEPTRDDETRLLKAYRTLNASGRDKVIGYAEDLADLPKYRESASDRGGTQEAGKTSPGSTRNVGVA